LKKIELDTAKIEELAGSGLTEQEICLCIGISRTTLYRRKRDAAAVAEAIERGKAKAHAVVANALFELCKERNLGAIVWFEKSRCGMSEDAELIRRIEQLERTLEQDNQK
jgi:DNA invertase Pin-like site-specific DNA recombinase